MNLEPNFWILDVFQLDCFSSFIEAQELHWGEATASQLRLWCWYHYLRPRKILASDWLDPSESSGSDWSHMRPSSELRTQRGCDTQTRISCSEAQRRTQTQSDCRFQWFWGKGKRCRHHDLELGWMCWVEVLDIHLHRKVPEFDKQYSRHPPEHCVITWKTDSWVFTLTHVTLCIHIYRFGLKR